MISREDLLKRIERLRGEPIRDFVRKEEEWNDYTEYVDADRICPHPLVSCCVFTYNQEKYIRQCLESIVCQKADFAYEVLVCEDCSTDGTLAICREFQERYPEKVRIIHANRNYYHGVLNFRRGYELARGKYLAICEGDDYWCNERKIELQVREFEKNPKVTICYTNFVHDKNGVLSAPLMSASFLENCRTKYTKEDFVRGTFPDFKTCFATASIMLKRSDRLELSASEIGRKRLAMGDMQMDMYLARKGKVAIVPSVCSVYRLGTGITAKNAYRNLRLCSDGIYVFVYFNGDILDCSLEARRAFCSRVGGLTHFYRVPMNSRFRIILFILGLPIRLGLSKGDWIRLLVLGSPFSPFFPRLLPILKFFRRNGAAVSSVFLQDYLDVCADILCS